VNCGENAVSLLVAYLIFHVLCAIYAYGSVIHGLCSLDRYLTKRYGLIPEVFKISSIERFGIVLFSLFGGPISLVIAVLQNLSSGYGFGLKFNA